MTSLNPYSTGNEVVGGIELTDEIFGKLVLILILLEMRLLVNRKKNGTIKIGHVLILILLEMRLLVDVKDTDRKVSGRSLNPYSTGNEVVGLHLASLCVITM